MPISAAWSKISKEYLLLLGNFNARVGLDHDSWPSCLGRFGVCKINENGQRLLELCSYHGLCVTNSYFQTKPQHKVSWGHPRLKHWHQLDMAVIKRASLKLVLLTCTYQSADCYTDHSLVCCKIRLQPKKFHRTRQAGKPHINTTMMQYPEKVEDFAKSFEDALSADHSLNSASDKWDHLRESRKQPLQSLRGRPQSDWFEAKSSEMDPVIEAKRDALAEYKCSPSVNSLQPLARSKVHQAVRRCANEYW